MDINFVTPSFDLKLHQPTATTWKDRAVTLRKEITLPRAIAGVFLLAGASYFARNSYSIPSDVSSSNSIPEDISKTSVAVSIAELAELTLGALVVSGAIGVCGWFVSSDNHKVDAVVLPSSEEDSLTGPGIDNGIPELAPPAVVAAEDEPVVEQQVLEVEPEPAPEPVPVVSSLESAPAPASDGLGLFLEELDPAEVPAPPPSPQNLLENTIPVPQPGKGGNWCGDSICC